MVAQACTISGGSGAGTINISFTAQGSPYSLGYVNSILIPVDAFLAAGDNTTVVGPEGGQAFFQGANAPVDPTIYQLKADTTQVGPETFSVGGSGYVLDTVGGAITLNTFSGGGDSVMVVGTSEATTVNAFGSDNLIVFVNGNNVYNGSTVSGDTGDTIVGGTGNDTINTGAGSATVNAGTGYDMITLNDTGSGAYNDAVYLDTGIDSVTADGTGDFVLATTSLATITGGSGETSTSFLTVDLLNGTTGTAGNDLVNGGAGYLTVLAASDGDTVNGGTGGLTFIGAAGISATVNSGVGVSLVFGANMDNLTLGNVSGEAGGIVAIAGSGNETLNGAGATGAMYIFGSTDSAATDSLVGGAGNDTLVAGLGTETLTGGAGDNTFLIDSVGAAGAMLTISDFNSNDTLGFSGFTADQVATALAGGTDQGGNFVITFADTSTTVTFTGITSESQLDGHIVTF